MAQNDANYQKLQQEQIEQLIGIMTVNSNEFPEDQKKSIQFIVANAMFKFNTEKEISQGIKKAMEQQFNGERYNVIVGRHFGANISTTTDRYAYIQVGTLQVLIFRSQN